jgi:Ca2+-binding EF-hand superfamily protein
MSWDEAMGYFHKLDQNEDGILSRNEFFSNTKKDGDDNKKEEDMLADAEWIWKDFAGPEGMKFENFEKAVRSKEANISMDMIKKAWDKGDSDDNDHMSYDEFMRLVK